MRNKFQCIKTVYEKFSKYSSKLTHYPKINVEVYKWLKEYKAPAAPNKIKYLNIELRNFKLGEFRNRFLITSKDWSGRLFEEEQKLEILLDFYRKVKTNFSLVRAEFNKNPRIICCTIEFKPKNLTFPILINFEIRLPLKYPFRPPKACNFSRYDFIRNHHDFKRWDDDDPEFKGFRFACFGKLDSRWKKNGSMGIAHYIQLLCYYAAFDHFSFKFNK